MNTRAEITIIPEWMQILADDLRAIQTERVYNARQELIQCYYEIGERIVTDENWQKWQKGNGSKLSHVTELSGVSERNLRRAVQFFELCPTPKKLNAFFDKAEEGKNLSWHKIVNNYLPDKQEAPDIEPCVCPACGREHTKVK